MASFYADENFDYPYSEALRALGHDVITVQDAGERGGDDAHVLALANSFGRIVLTLNRRDFARLHRANSNHAGIISCTKDEATALAARIHDAVTAAGDIAGQHIHVNRQS